MHRLQRLGLSALLVLPAVVTAQTPGARSYDIVAEDSAIQWLVYKAGAFARFGHNHVISVGAVDGHIDLAADPAATEWELVIPVADLVVDKPELRAVEGEDFASVPSADDIAGTRRNMLSETVLNGEQFPLISVRGNGFSGTLDDAMVHVVVEMLGRSISLELPAQIVVDGDGLTASGEFSLSHADLGMKPFSVMMGALQVGEQLDFSYRIHAVARDR